MAEHDKECSGCYTEQQFKESGAAFLHDYLAHCVACGGYIQGDTEHRVGGKTYHKRCIPTEAKVLDA